MRNLQLPGMREVQLYEWMHSGSGPWDEGFEEATLGCSSHIDVALWNVPAPPPLAETKSGIVKSQRPCRSTSAPTPLPPAELLWKFKDQRSRHSARAVQRVASVAQQLAQAVLPTAAPVGAPLISPASGAPMNQHPVEWERKSSL